MAGVTVITFFLLEISPANLAIANALATATSVTNV